MHTQFSDAEYTQKVSSYTEIPSFWRGLHRKFPFLHWNTHLHTRSTRTHGIGPRKKPRFLHQAFVSRQGVQSLSSFIHQNFQPQTSSIQTVSETLIFRQRVHRNFSSCTETQALEYTESFSPYAKTLKTWSTHKVSVLMLKRHQWSMQKVVVLILKANERKFPFLHWSALKHRRTLGFRHERVGTTHGSFSFCTEAH